MQMRGEISAHHAEKDSGSSNVSEQWEFSTIGRGFIWLSRIFVDMCFGLVVCKETMSGTSNGVKTMVNGRRINGI
jgi:hypothetical protein